MRLSVPGNILLLGEYAVLEEGGLGLAVAVERRVRVTLRPAVVLEVCGTWPAGSFRWSRDEQASSRLVTSVVSAVESAVGRQAGVMHIDIDSTELFDASGRKKGLGSSAAAAAGLTAALLAAAGVRPTKGDPAGAAIALQAHRAAQDGRGSGYDVLCSWHGGSGRFSGGKAPSWTPAPLPAGIRLALFAGPAPVRTADAVILYADWKRRNPAAACHFLEESNKRVSSFIAAVSADEAAARWALCRDLGVELGDAVGVPAGMPVPRGVDPGLCKAVGAGNELGVCLLPAGVETLLDPVSISSEGLQWED